MDNMSPRELTTILLSYTEQGYFGDPSTSTFLKHFEKQFRSKHDMMNSEDISKYYHCFTLLDSSFEVDGQFYRYLQKALTKTIKTFDSGNMRFMFTNFENSRLNTGVKGRLTD